MLAIVGFIMIGILIVALLKFNCLPITVFSTLPLIAALIVGSGVSGSMTMLAKGIIQVLPTAALFVGSITYFGIMNDVGLFDRPISMLSKRIKPNVFSVLAIAASVAMIAHLDGSGVATLLITVPAFLPIVKGLKIRVMPFSFIVTMCIGVMNFLPWGGPLGRAATVVGSDAVTLWKEVIPVQIFGIFLVYIACFLISRQEERKGYFVYQPDVRVSLRELSQEEHELRRPKLLCLKEMNQKIVVHLHLNSKNKSLISTIAVRKSVISLLDKWIAQATNTGFFKEKDNRSSEDEELFRLRKEN